MRAKEFCSKYGGTFISREEKSLEALFRDNPECQNFVIFAKSLPFLYCRQTNLPLFFHPNIAALRLEKLYQGGRDRLLDLTDLKTGMTVLDGTFGLGSDSLILAWGVGEKGKIIAVEGSRAVFSIMESTLETLKFDENCEIAYLLKRIELKFGNYIDICRASKDNAFDLVYLDPMFDLPRSKSVGILPLREWAVEGLPVDEEIQEMLRVTKSQVIIKEAKGSRWWGNNAREIESFLEGKRYQSVRYRVIKKE